MEEKFLNVLSRFGLPAGSGILLAVSGGPDSMAMLHLFHRAQPAFPFGLHAAHLHHGIRGKEADEDAALVQQVCEELRIPYSLYRFHVPSFAVRKKLSLEEAGRRIRRHFLLRCAKAKQMNFIALAHTADDQAETILMNFFRGAGPAGLGGMLFYRPPFLRPLLEFKKPEIFEFLSRHRLPYRMDSSNQDLRHLRNRVRHEVFPYLARQVHGEIKENLWRTARVLEEEEKWWESYLEPLFQAKFRPLHSRVWELQLEEDLPVAIQRRLLRKFLFAVLGSLEGISFEQLERMRGLLGKGVGKRFEFDSYRMERTREGLALAKLPPGSPGKIQVTGETQVAELPFFLQVTRSLP